MADLDDPEYWELSPEEGKSSHLADTGPAGHHAAPSGDLGSGCGAASSPWHGPAAQAGPSPGTDSRTPPSPAVHSGLPSAQSTPKFDVIKLDLDGTIDTSCHVPTVLRYLPNCEQLYLDPTSDALALLWDIDDLTFFPTSPGKLPRRHVVPNLMHAEVISKAISFVMRYRKDCGKLTRPREMHGEWGFSAPVVDLPDAIWRSQPKLREQLPKGLRTDSEDTPASLNQKRHDLLCAMIYTMLYFHHADLLDPIHNGEIRPPRFEVWLDGQLDSPTDPPRIMCWCRPAEKDANPCPLQHSAMPYSGPSVRSEPQPERRPASAVPKQWF